jgi:hypothetical protein
MIFSLTIVSTQESTKKTLIYKAKEVIKREYSSIIGIHAILLKIMRQDRGLRRTLWKCWMKKTYLFMSWHSKGVRLE